MTDDAVVAEALALGAATLGESGARRMHLRVKPVWPAHASPGPHIRCGAAPATTSPSTSRWQRAPAGTVLVADMGGERDYGYWGEVLTTAAEVRAIAGLVIDACVRDCDALAGPRVPGVLDRPRAHGRDRRCNPARSIARSPSATSRSSRATGSSATSTASSSCPAPSSTRCSQPAATRAAKEAALFATLRAGGSTVEEFGLDTTLVEGV